MIGSTIFHCKKLTQSSVDWAKEHFDNAPDGALFLADSYSVARGREGRLWHLRDGQLVITCALKPGAVLFGADDAVCLINMAIALGIVEPLLEYGVRIKSPNDFVFEGKKLGGVLIDGVWRGNVMQGVVVGFALNVNNLFSDNDELQKIAVSLREISGRMFDLDDLQKKLCVSIDYWYDMWGKGDRDAIVTTWQSRLSPLGYVRSA